MWCLACGTLIKECRKVNTCGREGTEAQLPPGILSRRALHGEARPGQTVTPLPQAVTGYGLPLERKYDLGLSSGQAVPKWADSQGQIFQQPGE